MVRSVVTCGVSYLCGFCMILSCSCHVPMILPCKGWIYLSWGTAGWPYGNELWNGSASWGKRIPTLSESSISCSILLVLMNVNGQLVQVLSSGSHMCLSDNDFVKAAAKGTGKQLSGYWSLYLFWFCFFQPVHPSSGKIQCPISAGTDLQRSSLGNLMIPRLETDLNQYTIVCKFRIPLKLDINQYRII